MMNGEIYRNVIIAAKESQDGETETVVTVTQEANGYAVWFDSYDVIFLIEHDRFRSRDLTIDFARDWADERRNNIRHRAGLPEAET